MELKLKERSFKLFYSTPFGAYRNKPGFHLVKDNWNDFGFYTLYKLFHLDNDLKETEIGYVKIGFKEQKEGQHSNLQDIFDIIPSNYFSLGQSVNYYSKLRRLGDDIRMDCLIGLNDIAYDEKIYNNAIKEEVVKTSLLRELNLKTITNQFRRIARGGAVLTDYNFEFTIPSDEKNSKLYFEVIHESLPPSNIHTIIGTNGSGKTTILKEMINGYLEDSLNANFSNAIFISFSIFDKNGHYESNNPQKEYYYVGAKTCESQTKSQEELKLDFYESVKRILSKKRHYYLYRMLEILLSDNNLKDFNLIDILDDFINSSQDNIAVQNCSTLFSNIFDKLSSGHQIILLSLTKVVELIVEKTLILIDEPETHLHPPLLSAFIRALSELSITENAMVILATHSPVVLQEIPKSCVSIVRRHGMQFKIDRPRFETFGENVGVLTEEVFGLEIPKTGFHMLLRKIVEENPDYDTILELFNNELSIEAKSIIRTYINEINKS